MSKVISFEPRVGKAQTGQTSGGFTAIIPEDKYWVFERKIVFLILFFKYCVVLTWKIVVPPKASVLYIYIDL